MALAKTTVSISLAGGIDKSRAHEVVDPPALAELTDARWDKAGEVGKRFVQESLTSPSYSASYQPTAITEVDGQPVVHHPLTGAYKRDAYDGSFDLVSGANPRLSWVRTDVGARANNSLRRPDVAVYRPGADSPDLMCLVWEDSTAGSAYYAFFAIDPTTGGVSQISGPTAFSSNLYRGIKVVFVGDAFLAFGWPASSATLYVARYGVAAGTYTFGAPAAITPNANTADDDFDVISSNSYAHLCYQSGATTYRFKRFDKDAVEITSLALTNHPAKCLYHDVSGGRVYSGDFAGNVGVFDDDYSGSGAAVTTVYTDPTYGTIERATIAAHNGSWIFAMSGKGQSETQCGVYLATLTYSGGPVKGTNGFVPHVVLAGRAWSDSASNAIIPVADQALIEDGTTEYSGISADYAAPCAYLSRPVIDTLSRLTLAACGRYGQDAIDLVANGNTAAALRMSHLARFEATTAGPRISAYTVAYDLRLGAAQRRAVDLVRARVEDVPAGRDVTSQSLRIIGSGTGTTCLDGRIHAEMGPSPVTFCDHGGYEAVAPTSSADGNGPYLFSVVNRWIDAKGNLHRSAPSMDTEIAAGALRDGSFYPARLVFSRPYLTAINGERVVDYDVEVYQQNGSVTEPRLIGVVKPAVYATNPNLAYVRLEVGTPPLSYGVNVVAPATLASYPARYTSGEVLEAYPSPPLVDLVSTQQRLWGLSAEKGRTEVWYTKPIESQVAPEWAQTNVVRIPAEGGECTALAALDDKVIVFKQRRLYVLFGNPGSATGSGSTLQQPRLRSSDVGCSDARTVVEGPFGVAFLAESGFHVLTPGLELRRIGDRVLDIHDGREITSGVLVPAEREVRWTIATYTVGDTSFALGLAWNYELDQWSQWTEHDAVHACVVSGVYHRVLTAGGVRREVADDWDGSDVEPSLTTAWLKLSGVQGYQRVWRIILLGRWYEGGCTVQIGYDYQSAWTDTISFTSAELSAATVSGRTQITLHPSRQKCEALRIRITEVQAGGQEPEVGRGQEWIALDLECGVKKGGYKLLSSSARK